MQFEAQGPEEKSKSSFVVGGRINILRACDSPLKFAAQSLISFPDKTQPSPNARGNSRYMNINDTGEYSEEASNDVKPPVFEKAVESPKLNAGEVAYTSEAKQSDVEEDDFLNKELSKRTKLRQLVQPHRSQSSSGKVGVYRS